MRTDGARKKTTDDDVVEQVRPVVLHMVQQTEAVGGSRMLAYDAVGRALGETGAWVRKLLGRRDVLVKASTYQNITAAYLDLCALTEAAAAARREHALTLKQKADALEAHFKRLDVDHSGGRADAPSCLPR